MWLRTGCLVNVTVCNHDQARPFCNALRAHAAPLSPWNRAGPEVRRAGSPRSRNDIAQTRCDPRGVNPQLVHNVRRALDEAGHTGVKIVASGGFTAAKIEQFETLGVPVDAYGVGSSLIRGQNDYTADVVLVDGVPCAKAGRKYMPNPRLERVH